LGVADARAFVADAFYDYIDRTRARPFRLQTQYNSWFDLGAGNRSSISNSATLTHRELTARGVPPLSAYVVDDGWQNSGADWSDGNVWPVNTGRFDADFASNRAHLKTLGSHLGLWLSPGCLFGAEGAARKMAEQGYESLAPWMSMAGPRYMDALENRMAALTKQGVTYFKLDGIFGHLNVRNFELHGARYGLPEMPHLIPPDMTANDQRLNDAQYDEIKIYYLSAGTERLMRLFARLGKINPDIYLVISNGAWLSPWWLQHVDAVWMINAGDAASGTSRSEELVYRDDRYHEFHVRQRAQFPLNAVFNHEPKKLESNETKHTFRNYLYMSLSRGTGFVELYIKPSKLAAYDWDVLAEGLRWAGTMTPAFKRARMYGGSPKRGEVYGFTGWDEKLGYISFHNPAGTVAVCRVTLDRALGMPKGTGRYLTSSPLPAGNADGIPPRVKAGDVLTVKLEPREVRVICFSAKPLDWSALTALQKRTQDDFQPPPPPPPPPADHPILGTWSYRHNGTTYTRTFGKDGICHLKQDDALIWSRPFQVRDATTAVVEGNLVHTLGADGRLSIEGRYMGAAVR
jgi:hypothetical protein